MTKLDGRAYQARIDALVEQGVDVHGEASLIASMRPLSVLDAGCGTGRVAIELARRGIAVVGVDVDASMLAEAERLAPDLEWIRADLTTLALARTFDVVLLAGNVPLFCAPSSRGALVIHCADHVKAGGSLVAGFQVDQGYSLGDFDRACTSAGLFLLERWATWDGRPFVDSCDYAVSLYRR